MRENRPYGSEGGAADLNRPFLPVFLVAANAFSPEALNPLQASGRECENPCPHARWRKIQPGKRWRRGKLAWQLSSTKLARA